MDFHVPLSSLEDFPTEVLEKVVLALVNSTMLGPPTDLPSVLCLSKSIYAKISFNSNQPLYSAIFSQKFDDKAVVRRLGETAKHASNRANELISRFNSLKRIKYMSCRALLAASTGLDDLWVAYLLFLENEGRNYDQLVRYACVNRFAFNFFKPGGPFHDGLNRNNGWKYDNEVNALVAWIFWFTDKDRAAGETFNDRKLVIAIFSHVFVGSFKYASAHAPITSFCIPPPIMPLVPPETYALPPAALPCSRLTFIKTYFGHPLLVTNPLLTAAALLISAVRLEIDTPTINSEGWEAHHRPATPFVEWGPARGSEQYDHDWTRLITCYSPWSNPRIKRRVFTPGMMAGTWVGRYFQIPKGQFGIIMDPPPFRVSNLVPRVHVYSCPMQFYLIEYHLHDQSKLIGYDDMSRDSIGQGVFNAWLPRGVKLTKGDRDMDLFSGDPINKMRFENYYEAYDPASAARRALDRECPPTGPYGDDVHDIILTARTEEAFAKTHGYERYYGRVRDWDGLILLVSEATSTKPSLIFSGYIHGNQNLVGRWRETQTPVDIPGWEGTWSMTKVA